MCPCIRLVSDKVLVYGQRHACMPSHASVQLREPQFDQPANKTTTLPTATSASTRRRCAQPALLWRSRTRQAKPSWRPSSASRSSSAWSWRPHLCTAPPARPRPRTCRSRSSRGSPRLCCAAQRCAHAGAGACMAIGRHPPVRSAHYAQPLQPHSQAKGIQLPGLSHRSLAHAS